MESTKGQVRVIWPLLKARVVDRSATHVKLGFGYDHGAPTTITIAVDTSRYDIRNGDLLTLYTEVLLAQPSQPPVQ